MTMNTKDLAKDVAAKRGVTEKQALEVMAGLLEGIAEAAAKGEEISLPGFGKFKVKDTPERSGRNPSTGEAITIAASKKITFTPAKALKDRL
ncbi:DNA-binding protein HU-beta [Sphingomonas zeae]|uniref:DNA-binding protein HU-beta n=9 Tax=Pseudomonadota TaxID=1224 RepID=A0ABR6KBU6_9SPHN|nr:DNA-binding protein HU-beta [Sphingomonas aquatilis]MBB4049369.1 DNA-binding protein HU-beta [Sphingomonas zeae]MBB4610580.1 DNA-binding protein HU-beta [Sphingomonas yabuuchiae]